MLIYWFIQEKYTLLHCTIKWCCKLGVKGERRRDSWLRNNKCVVMAVATVYWQWSLISAILSTVYFATLCLKRRTLQDSSGERLCIYYPLADSRATVFLWSIEISAPIKLSNKENTTQQPGHKYLFRVPYTDLRLVFSQLGMDKLLSASWLVFHLPTPVKSDIVTRCAAWLQIYRVAQK